MLTAAASVGGSPIATSVYGGANVVPSTTIAPGVPPTQVSTPTRIGAAPSPAIWIASAPAARNSCTASSRTSGPTCRDGSVSRMLTPGPVAGTVPTWIESAASRARASASAASEPSVSRLARLACRSAISWRSAASRRFRLSSTASRSAGRAESSESPEDAPRTWVAIATPSTAISAMATTPSTRCDTRWVVLIS